MEEFHLYILLLTLLALILSRYLTSLLRDRRKLPSPPALPLIGNLHQLGRLPHRSLWDLSRKYGPLMLLHLGSKPTLVVSSAKTTKEILKNHDLAFAGKPVQSTLRKIFFDAKDLINLPYGDQWRKVRSIFVHKLLSTSRVKSFNYIREEETALLMEKIKKSCMSSSPVNLTEMLKVLTNDMICRAAFGKKHSETKHGEEFLGVIDEVVGLLSNFTYGEFVPSLDWINELKGFNARVDKCAKKLDEIMDAVVKDHLSSFSENQSRENFIDILLGIYKGYTPDVDIDLVSLKAVILDIFGAGTETSSTTMAWVTTELIRHPTVMEKLQDEIRRTMNGKQHITDNDLQKMHYLKAVVKETFRFHPPVTTIPREARGYVKFMGYDIEPGTMVLFNMWAIGRDLNCWHEPERFMPDRFLNCSLDFRGMDYESIPFGAGRRICPGLGFAALAIEHTVANLMHKFDWGLPGGAKGEDLDVTERQGVTVGRKNPLIVVPTKCYF